MSMLVSAPAWSGALSVAVALVASHAGPRPSAAPPLTFNRVAIRDPMVNNIEGAVLLVPDGWRVEGGFAWLADYSIQVNLVLRVSDPRTGAAIEWHPWQWFVWTPQSVSMRIGQNWNGSVYAPPPRSAPEFVQAFYGSGALRHLQGARIVRSEELPRLAQEAARGNPGVTARVTRLRYAYQHGGQAWEEDVYVTLAFSGNQALVQWYGGAHSMRAPAGMLDRMTPVLGVPLQSMQVTLDWSAAREYVRGLFVQRRHRSAELTRQWGQQLAQHREEMRQMHQQVYAERQASQARQNFAVREMLGGIETYTDPFQGQRVELPAGYKNYWVNNKGQYVLSEDPTYDPRQGSTLDWRRMGRAGP